MSTAPIRSIKLEMRPQDSRKALSGLLVYLKATTTRSTLRRLKLRFDLQISMTEHVFFLYFILKWSNEFDHLEDLELSYSPEHNLVEILAYVATGVLRQKEPPINPALKRVTVQGQTHIVSTTN
ncbi:hypothetical protein FRC08_016323 [Ceratobasidium sp. 394]|nr:hypothetical protein FRC08_016323 [Ceratobasidium sp. 394]KAG9096673.1 hypothetical protein FS749_007969 [Ceratobasidium sp. UAMH 11750]